MYTGVVELHEGWLRLRVESSLRTYLARLYERTYCTGRLGAPSNGPHITIAREWGIHGDVATFIGLTYSFVLVMEPYTNGNAVWLPVICAAISKTRKILGAESSYEPHFCIGYIK